MLLARYFTRFSAFLVFFALSCGELFPFSTVVSGPDSSLISHLKNTSRNFSMANKLDSAIYYDGLLFDKMLSAGDTAGAAMVSNYTALVFIKRFEYDSAFFHLQRGVKIISSNIKRFSTELAYLYSTYGKLYKNMASYSNSIAYYKMALDVQVDAHMSPSDLITKSYLNLGQVYAEMGEYFGALSYFDKAINYCTINSRNPKPYLALINGYIGAVYLDKGDVKLAKDYFIKSRNLSPGIVYYQELGEINTIEGNYPVADSLLSKSLEIRLKSLGTRHFLTAVSFNSIGELRKAEGKNSEAADYFSKALASSLKTEPALFFSAGEPEITNIISVKELIRAITGKTDALYRLSLQHHSNSHLNEAKYLLKSALALLDKVQQYYQIDNHKLRIRELSDKMMDVGIAVCYELFAVTGLESNLSEALRFSEAKRANVFNEKKMKRFEEESARIPDSLIKEREKLLGRIHSVIFSQIPENDERRSVLDSYVNRQYNEWITEYDSLCGFINSRYPAFTEKEKSFSPLVPNDICRGLKKNELAVEYSVTGNKIYIFVFTPERYLLIENRKSTLFGKWLVNIQNSLRKIEKNEFDRNSKRLYGQLIDPIEGFLEGKEKLTIIPTTELSVLPFEALLSGDGIPLAKRIAVEYQMSFGGSVAGLSRPAMEYPYYFIGFAPKYDGSSSLPHVNNVEEISFIGKILNERRYPNHLYSNDLASKENFRRSVNQSRILHIAGHGFSGTDSNREGSLVFSKSDSDGLNEHLTASEIASSNIKNDLVVLSSCEGGSGRELKGEGVLSVGRSLLAAGAKHALVALWKVPDKNTKMFMAQFYQELMKDQDYAKALSRTKRKFIDSKDSSFPAMWSAFVLLR